MKTLSRMDLTDILRRIRRSIDASISYKKLLLIVFFALAFFLYVGPYIYKLLHSPRSNLHDPSSRCLSDRLATFIGTSPNFDVNIRHSPPLGFENAFLPFVGNGKIGIVIDTDGIMYLKSGRALSLKVPFHPVVSLGMDDMEPQQASVLQFTTGIAHRFHCFHKPFGSLDIHYLYYAHRVMPALFIQDIKITNPTDQDVYFDVDMPGVSDINVLESSTIQVDVEGQSEKLPVITGKIPVPDNSGQFFALAIIHSAIPKSIRIKKQSTESLLVAVSVYYMGPISVGDFQDAIDEAIRQAQSNYSRAMKLNSKRLREDHRKVWQELWNSGFSISYSKASKALNGDQINATIYYILSHTRSPLHEIDIQQSRRQDLMLLLASPDRCYDGHHTLQASTLWSHLKTAEDIINVVSLWKLTLEKQGCQTMLQAGADGAIQAILLSFGALKFSNHHLEFLTHPMDLHRDYHFRRISYGNGTYLNISVIVGDDNKAVLYVAVDHATRSFYACDGGCLDAPVVLSTEKKQFPVKLTSPPTAILYITDNKQHMQELKHTIHVKEIVEAPAHEHHIIALHRHGHHLGGLPTMFWASIAFLVLVFHLFLFKLIYNEYCANSNHNHHVQEKARARYAL